jgi:putative FmdB family regulatory protein
MPIYEYECEKCHSRFEVKRSFGEDGSAKCPECRGKACRVFTSVPIIFKGSGFYVTDHKKTNSASTPEKNEKNNSVPAPEKKVETPKPVAGPKKN